MKCKAISMYNSVTIALALLLAGVGVLCVKMEEREMERGLFGAGEEPKQQVIGRESSKTCDIDVSGMSVSRCMCTTCTCITTCSNM